MEAPNRPRRHDLVVGGTGMLRELSLTLAAEAGAVSVIARHRGRLAELATAAAARGGTINPLPLDYRDTGALSAGLESAGERFGPIGLAVAWIHRTAPEAPLAVARSVGTAESPGSFFHVLSSGTADPGRPSPARRALFESLPNLTYHEVLLGFVPGPAGSRWLTDQEICRGILKAIAERAPRAVVGTVEPWSARP